MKNSVQFNEWVASMQHNPDLVAASVLANIYTEGLEIPSDVLCISFESRRDLEDFIIGVGLQPSDIEVSAITIPFTLQSSLKTVFIVASNTNTSLAKDIEKHRHEILKSFMVHEFVHVNQMKEEGVVAFNLEYGESVSKATFRQYMQNRFEKEAYMAQQNYLASKGVNIVIYGNMKSAAKCFTNKIKGLFKLAFKKITR